MNCNLLELRSDSVSLHEALDELLLMLSGIGLESSQLLVEFRLLLLETSSFIEGVKSSSDLLSGLVLELAKFNNVI